ncbi:DUF5050 domain-containing protein [Clostridium sp. YIM B02515]|uniref:DUF5050 domain-containing protein n=1 Tax=Clostridium rhizosphaerae TaxID=2803861 RepID=A0ABS1T585_9CLOT|nr:DUF5050 domain-containing protein [Clostridium rhizosphaerae]MBL4934272.1 DUF5050 domain-containing protein [Clostridium rhizosphaerae]
MKGRKIISFLISTILILGLLAGCSSSKTTTSGSAAESKVGNTGGNITNRGVIAKQGDWIYYCNFSDNRKLYKIKTDGTEKTKLNDDHSTYINVLGDWVYYTSGSSAGTYGGKLYKIKTDGSGKTKLSDNEAGYINISSDWIYYSNYDDMDKLYKIKTDGTKKTKLSDNRAWYINISGDWIYYSKIVNNRGQLYKIKTDGSKDTKLNEDAQYVNVVDDWIYYMTNYTRNNPGGKEGGNLSRMKIDGTGETKINDNQSDYINISGDWIFYANYNDMGKLYKIKTDGTEKTKLNDDMPENISVAGDWIYYKVFTGGVGGGTLYKIKLDGSEKTSIGLPKEEVKKETDIQAAQSKEDNSGSSVEQDQQQSYKKYINDRFGFSIEYPGTFVVKLTPDNNDGIVLSSKDGSAELTVSGINNVLDETVTSNYNKLLQAHSDAAYKTQQNNWHIVSWIEGDKIVYQKTVVGNGSINTFIIKYPLSQKDSYNSIVSHVNSTFKTPGIDSAH